MRPTLIATLLALAATSVSQDTQPTEDPTSPEPAGPELIEIAAGEGEAPVEGGSFEYSLSMWTDRYEGTPMGAQPLVMVGSLDSAIFTGLVGVLADMKVGGKKRGIMPAKEFFGEKITRMGHVPPVPNMYFDVSLDKVWKDEPFETTVVGEGAGDRVAANGETVKMHYTGWSDGFGGEKKFDSSLDRKAPFVFELGAGQVIEGWERGVLGMKVGEKRHLSVPHHLAYGNRQQGPMIAPYSRLYFEIELVGFVELGVETVSEGEGQPAQAGDTVEMHYTGWTDGFEGSAKFDSSLDRGPPFSFQLGKGQVIKGWDQGIVGMKPGEVRRLTIPPELGYGARAMGDKIPANSTLYFEVKYLGLKGK